MDLSEDLVLLDYFKNDNFLKKTKFLNTNKNINFLWLDRISYNKAWQYQKKIHTLILEDRLKDTVLFLEHDHVYTLGKNADSNHLLPSYNKNAEIIQSDRGGDITYHGPGQLVVYPIINLKKYKMSVSWYIKSIEEIIINTLKNYHIKSNRLNGLTGVWVEDEKIAAIGVRLSRWITMHGFSINLRPDMTFYNGMIPCGIFEYGVTSIDILSDKIPTMMNLVDTIIKNILFTFEPKNEV